MITSTIEFAQTHDGVEQFLRRWTPDRETQAAMVLIHGIGEHSGRYEHVGAAFAAAGIDVVAPDQRGFGRTGGRRGHVEHFDHFVADVEPLIADRRELGVPVVLMGHSLGGLVATAYLVGDRPQPDLAVLSAPALAARLPGWKRALAPALGTIAPGVRIPADFDGSLLSRDADVQVAYETDPLRVKASTARLGREVLTAMASTSRRLDRLRVPTYVLHGSDDALVPLRATDRIAELELVTRRVWPELRHECLNEPERDQVLAETVAWIDRHL